MKVWGRLKHYFIPSKQNAYRPHLLGHSWLMVFLAIVLATEGFLVADLVSQQPNESFLAAVAAPVRQTQGEPASATHSFTQSLERQYTRLLDTPQPPVNGTLGAMALLLSGLVALAFFVRLDIQPTQMLAGGLLVAGLALSFLYLNGQILNAGINTLHETQASATLGL